MTAAPIQRSVNPNPAIHCYPMKSGQRPGARFDVRLYSAVVDRYGAAVKQMIMIAAACAVAFASLAGCSADSADATADAATTATSAAAPASSDTSATAAPESTGNDAELCKAATTAKQKFAATTFAAADSNGNIPPAAAKKAFKDLADSLTATAGSGTGEVATALKDLAAVAAEAAKADDPINDDSAQDAFEKVGTKVDNACKGK